MRTFLHQHLCLQILNSSPLPVPSSASVLLLLSDNIEEITKPKKKRNPSRHSHHPIYHVTNVCTHLNLLSSPAILFFWINYLYSCLKLILLCDTGSHNCSSVQSYHFNSAAISPQHELFPLCCRVTIRRSRAVPPNKKKKESCLDPTFTFI